MKRVLKKYLKARAGWSLFPLLSLQILGACSVSEATSETAPQWLQSENLADANVNKALSAKVALKINLKTNRITLFKAGKAVDQWNIASADVSGEFHDNISQSTPKGIFAVEDMQACPEWLPRSPKDPATGKVATNEAERREIFKKNPDLFGACGAKNPLGSYAIWFYGEYGVHGNAAEWILELGDAEKRRVSGGCIRNPNSKIKDVFHQVLDTYQLNAFKAETLQLETTDKKKTLTQSLRKVDMKVVVGEWSEDPQLAASSPQLTPAPKPTVPAGDPKFTKVKCMVIGADPVLGIAPTYSQLPANNDNMFGFYSKGDEAYVKEDVPGTGFVNTTRGLLDKKYLGSCRSQD
ncbi:MAG: L,D-transpeptidase [Betaproteobacteria bacterium]|nr:L,D-transpeptidase [Betaproteobacteria bacterium]